MIDEEKEKVPEAAETGESMEAGDLASLQKALEEEKSKALQYLYNWQRAQADLLNYKKSSEKDRQEAIKFGNSLLLLSLLPVVDDLQRAVNSLPQEAGAGWAEGIRLIHKKLQSTLEAQGLTPIEAIGKPFDPFVHEAVCYQDGEEDRVLAEVEKGYKFQDRVLRPARVVLGRGREKGSEERPECRESRQ